MAGESIPSTINAILTKDTGIFSGIKNSLSDIYTVSNLSGKDKRLSFEIFQKNLLFVKGFCLVFIIVLAGVNYFLYRNLGMIETNPAQFALESAVFGVTAVLPFLGMAYLRNTAYDRYQLVRISVVLFIVFFILNYVLEISGIYQATFQDTEKVISGDVNNKFDFEKSVSRASEIMVVAIFIGSIITLFIVSYYISDTSPDYVNMKNVSPTLVFVMETVFVSVISAISIFLFAYDRNGLHKKTIFEFLLITLKFAILHCLLQYSGFYRSIYKK